MRVTSLLKRVVVLLISLCLLTGQVLAEDALRLRWNELAPAVSGQRVWLSLSGGERVAGTVREVEPAALRVEVRKTSNSKTHPKGLVSIPRSAVSTIDLHQPRGHKGIIIGGAVGGGIAAAAGGTLIAIGRNEGGTPHGAIMAGATAGPVAVGLLVGWLVDTIARRGDKRIVVVAE